VLLGPEKGRFLLKGKNFPLDTGRAIRYEYLY